MRRVDLIERLWATELVCKEEKKDTELKMVGWLHQLNDMSLINLQLVTEDWLERILLICKYLYSGTKWMNKTFFIAGKI